MVGAKGSGPLEIGSLLAGGGSVIAGFGVRYEGLHGVGEPVLLLHGGLGLPVRRPLPPSLEAGASGCVTATVCLFVSGEAVVAVSVEVAVEVTALLLVLPPISVTVISSIDLEKTVRSVVSFKALVAMCLATAASVLRCVVAMLLLLLGVRSRSGAARGCPRYRVTRRGGGHGVRLLSRVAAGAGQVGAEVRAPR
ncbi:hypothetical protein N4G69_47025 [Streptomyces mirabilis]|uniref:hypothetical protein n=1 Tax=Streptomyces mirabilis TaxID=68239 RepID=UPI0021C12967|nr:hypothetical protein [Streptomyces mirabilis]MCT9112996.1 hypothetical protein [Streptomyces mirabilis]